MLPVTFLLVCIFLVVLPIIDDPQLVGVALGIVAGGIPLYYLFIYWKSKPVWMQKLIHSSDLAVQKLFIAELSQE